MRVGDPVQRQDGVHPGRQFAGRGAGQQAGQLGTVRVHEHGADRDPALGGRPGAGSTGQPRPMRYSEPSRRLAGVSQKMLTQTLRSLERDGLLTRTVTPTVPVTVSYELTGLGLSLHQVMRGIRAWAEAHMDEVLANRAEYDTSHDG